MYSCLHISLLWLSLQPFACTDHTRLGVYMLSGELQHRGLLRFSLSPATYSDTLVLLVASMQQPWAILDALQRWAGALATHLDRIKLAPDKRRQAEEARE
jgi:dynein light intermediate chain 1